MLDPLCPCSYTLRSLIPPVSTSRIAFSSRTLPNYYCSTTAQFRGFCRDCTYWFKITRMPAALSWQSLLSPESFSHREIERIGSDRRSCGKGAKHEVGIIYLPNSFFHSPSMFYSPTTISFQVGARAGQGNMTLDGTSVMYILIEDNIGNRYSNADWAINVDLSRFVLSQKYSHRQLIYQPNSP